MTNIEIVLMDKDFKRIRAIRDFSSLIWTQKYYNSGGFEVHLPLRYINDCKNARYVFRADKENLGVVDTLKKENDDLTLKGDFLGILLNKRVIKYNYTGSGNAETVARNIVNQFCILSNPIPKLELGEFNKLGTYVYEQWTGESVYSVIANLLGEQELGFRLRYDIFNDKILFEVYQGLDRTTEQNVNTWCVLSDDFKNVLTATYEERKDKRNFCYVVGEDNSRNRVVVEVDETQGEERNELYVEATDIKAEGLSNSQFLELLRERGLTELYKYNNAGESVEIEVDMSNMRHMRFDLGDKCTYKDNELGFFAHGRITEITEITENGNIGTFVVLGKDQLTIQDIIKRGK